MSPRHHALAQALLLAPLAVSCGEEAGVIADPQGCRTISLSEPDVTSTTDGMSTTDGASSTTAPSPRCGDGVRDPGEQCDDGDDNGPGKACRDDCLPNACGDGDVGPMEECDDGNIVSNDACTAKCLPARCGDGITWLGEETCDDGNTDDGDDCPASCVVEWVVFVTSKVYFGDLVGLSGADAECYILGQELPNRGGQYMAWLGDDYEAPATRFPPAPRTEGRFVRPDGVVIASSWDDLTDGELAAPISITELGIETTVVQAWTGTTAAGALRPHNCGDWLSSSPGTLAYYGVIAATDLLWTHSPDALPCNEPRSLYCVQVSH